MSRYKAYSEYKESGLIGLGRIPIPWATQKIKYIFNIGRGRVISQEELDDSEYPVYSSQTMNDGCLGYIATYDFDCSQITWTTDGANAGTVFLRNGKHNCTNVCGTLQPKITDENLKYFLYCLEYVTQFYKRPDTNGAKIMNGEMAEIAVTLPTNFEKDKIAAFLDHETAKIDALIEKQQRLIELLKEKRQAVISHAVTKGLNPNAPMKDSGVEWLGEVPAHWEVLSLGKITLSKCDGPFGSGLKSEHYTENGVRVIRLQNIKLGHYSEGDAAFIDEIYYERSLRNHDVVPGDVLIAGLGDLGNPVGRACVAPEDIAPAMVKADCFRFRVDEKKVLPGFVAQQLSSSSYFDAGTLSNGSTRARIPLSLMATRKVAISPLDEQGKILIKISELTSKFNELEQAALSAIGLMQERRTALISAAVTGKIDVRDWQAAA